MKKLMIFGVFVLAIATLVLPGCGTYSVTVDYDLSLEKMVEAGNYDSVDLGICCPYHDNVFQWEIIEGNPADCRGQEEVQLELIHFEYLSAEAVLKKLDEMGYRPATIAELCAFGAKYPDEQKEFLIFALGSVFQDPQNPSIDHRVAALRSHDNEVTNKSHRLLHLHWVTWVGPAWHSACRFLAVPK